VSYLFLDSSCLFLLGSTKSICGEGEESIGVPSVASLEAESFLRRDGRDRDGENWIETSIRAAKL